VTTIWLWSEKVLVTDSPREPMPIFTMDVWEGGWLPRCTMRNLVLCTVRPGPVAGD
jgi:hypothetical protein